MKKLYLLIAKFILSRIEETQQELEYEIKFGFRNKDLSPRRCYKCLSKHLTEEPDDWIDGTVIGKYMVCECDYKTGYWYAGSWEI